ncbi:hypothetical protein BAE44_0017906 [Dichanthelium oligosanthes]|uniref:Uncharacterized protein n=1 Tax=Dichanthelium oligosanthes TaxID=888268 RepID=A0A1E5V7H1_9POAL|nr:hypothetical protein BAE44_0017906 [Dichanthelium oligosanthes]
MDRLVRMFHGGIVNENQEFKNMDDEVELFDTPPHFKDLVDRMMSKFGCGVDEVALRGYFDCGKARSHYVLMNLKTEVHWNQYKKVVEGSNVLCWKVLEEADIDDNEISVGSEEDEIREEEEDGGQLGVDEEEKEEVVVEHGQYESEEGGDVEGEECNTSGVKNRICTNPAH